MMKVLFFSINNIASPHFETELELMSNHQEKGDDVYVLKCAGNLERCYSNSECFQSTCFSCKLRFDIGMKRLDILKEKIFSLNKDIKFDGVPESFKNLEELKNFRVYGVNIGFGVATYLISELRSHKFDTILYKDKIFSTLKSSILVYESACELLERLKPDRVYIFNGRFFDVWPVVKVCEKLGVTFYTHERGGDARYVLFKNCLPHDLQFIKRDIEDHWDNFREKGDYRDGEGESFFVDKRNRTNKDFWGAYAKGQKIGFLPVGFDERKTNIAIFNSTIDEYESFEEYRNPIYKDDTESLIRILDEFKDREDLQFYLRVHPNLKNKDSAQIQEIRRLDSFGYKNLKIIWPEEKIDSYALLDKSDKVISFISTMIVEACFWGKPSILIGRAFYEDLGCCYKPKNHEEVIKLIRTKLEPKNKEDAIKYGFWCSTFGITYRNFKPTGKFTGTFMGKDLWDDFTLKDRLKVKLLVVKDMGLKRALLWQLTKLKRYVASKKEDWFQPR